MRSRGEGVWGCGVERGRLGKALEEPGGRLGRGGGEGACVGGCGVGRPAGEFRSSVRGSVGSEVGVGAGMVVEGDRGYTHRRGASGGEAW